MKTPRWLSRLAAYTRCGRRGARPRIARRACLAGAVLALSGFSQVSSAEPALEKQFQQPPDSGRPRTWWHWVSGNVSAEGITADLEAMKKIGLGGFQLFTVDQSSVKGPVKFMSPEWRGFVHQALLEADRLGLEVSIEGCEGWSESGGPWIKPEQGMQRVVWTEANVTGGARVSLALPQPPATRGFYEDVALLAFPMLKGDDLPRPLKLTVNVTNVDCSKLIDGDMATEVAFSVARNSPVQFDLAYDKPVTCRSLTVHGEPRLAGVAGELEVSADGVSYTRAGSITMGGVSAFAAATGTHFRLKFGSVRATDLRLSEISLAGARLNQLPLREGMRSERDVPFTDLALAADDVVDPAAIVDLTGKTEWDAPAGRWTIVRIGHTGTGATTHPSASAGLECDKMSRDAVRFHFEQMYGPIFADSPGQAGKSLRYILLDSWEAGCANWTALMPQEFAKRRGYELTRWLPVFTGRVVKDPDMAQRFLWDFRRTIADLVAEHHYGGAQAFAREHKMGLYAEAPGIGAPTVADNLACKGRTDISMGEFWVNRRPEDNIDDAKEAASAAHIYGQNIAAAEAFTSTATTAAWSNDPYGLKALGDMEFCLGINRFVFHRYAHQPWSDRRPGMSMGPWGINFERSNTWWKPGSAWIDYITRCQWLLQRGRFAADLLYFYGEGATARFLHRSLSPPAPAGFDYDVCNAEILLDRASVEDGAIELKSGMRYRVLVLPDTDRVTLPVLQKIQSLVRDGATVYGPRPVKSPSLSGPADADQTIQKIAAEVWGNCDGSNVTAHVYGKGRMLWGGSLASALPGAPDFQASQPDVMFIHRRDGQADIYFVSNQQKTGRTVDCTFRVTGKVPELWHPDTGRTETVALYRAGNGCTALPIRFDPVGSVFVVFRKDAPADHAIALARDGAGVADAPLRRQDDRTYVIEAPASGTYEIKLASGKTLSATVATLPQPLLVDGGWRLAFPPKLGAPATATFDHLMSWTESPDDGVKYFSGTATYWKEVTIPAAFFDQGRRVCLDLGAVKNLAEVIVNGKSLGVLWKQPFRVDITGAAKRGKNKLEIRVTNLWPNRLIGDQRLPENQRITWASVSQYNADAPLLPSGLLGPVRIMPVQTVIVKRR